MQEMADIAEKHSVTRAWLMAANALALIWFSLTANQRPEDMFLAFLWPIMFAASLAMLITGGYLLKPNSIRILINDELSAHNRLVAIRLCLIAASLLTGAVYYYALYNPSLPAMAALRLVIGPGVAVGLLCYAWLERR
jgi:hypothetical protein